MKILLTEDDPAWQRMIRELLEPEGHTIQLASSYAEAYSEFTAKAFDLVIVDLNLGSDPSNRDGVSLLEDAYRTGVPTIVVTGYGTPDMVRKANLYGVIGVVPKRFFNAGVFKQTVSEVVSVAATTPVPPTPQQAKEVGVLLRKLAAGGIV